MEPQPRTVLSRWRRSESLRRLARETRVTADNLILPIFVQPGSREEEPIASMPGVHRWSVERLAREARSIYSEGIPAIMVFGIPETKDAQGSASWNDQGIVQQALRAVKEAVPELAVMADLCFCEYTDHGHCGILDASGSIDAPATLKNLGRQAVSLASAGADVIAPSGMIDGMVAEVRRSLDEGGHTGTLILSYAAKYASAFYGPFRDAVDSAPEFGDRRSHQMDPPNAREALSEVLTDIAEGADGVMVKPALPYLDVIRRVSEAADLPVAAYQVSGEYSMIQAAAQNGWVDGDAVLIESLTAIRRAGATMILTYGARRAAALLKQAP